MISVFLKKIGKFLAENWIVIVSSFICATVLWGFVLANQNPERTKTIPNVTVSFEGEADLIARRLVIFGNTSDILPDVTAVVNTDLLSYSKLSAEDITATVSLRSVTGEGEYELRITATSLTGTVVRVVPDTVTVTVDRLTTKKIPVDVKITGEAPATCWTGEPVLSKDSIEIKGALSIISEISRAECTIDLTNRDKSFSESLTMRLIDSEGLTVPSEYLYGEVPSVTVSMEILPKKIIQLDIMNTLIGKDQLPANYEIYAAFTVPSSIMIVGEREDIDAIEMISLESWDITGMTTNQVKELELSIPDGIRVIGGFTSVTGYVNIREKIVEQQFLNIPISVRNLSSGYECKLGRENVNITITGRFSVMNQIDRSDIRLYVDLADLGVGVYTLPISFTLKNEALLVEVTYSMSYDDMTVVVAEKTR